MNVKSCERCRRLFQYYGGSFMCPDCIQEIDKQFNTVKAYLYDNPGSSLEKLCEETEVERSYVIRWLREGRLVMDERHASLLDCETCGKPIRSGRYCETCSGDLRRTLQGTLNAMNEKNAPLRTTEESRKKESKMHIKS